MAEITRIGNSEENCVFCQAVKDNNTPEAAVGFVLIMLGTGCDFDSLYADLCSPHRIDVRGVIDEVEEQIEKESED